MRKGLLLFVSLAALSWSVAVGHAQTIPTGKIVYIGSTSLRIIDLATGIDAPLPVSGLHPKLSPDGTRVVFTVGGGNKKNTGIFIINADGTGLTRLATFGMHPAWSPDATRIAFANSAPPSQGIFVVNSNGGSMTQLAEHGLWPAFSPTGTQIAFCSTKDSADYDLWIMNADGTNQQPFLSQIGADIDVQWSPASKLVFSRNIDRKYSYDVHIFEPVAGTVTRFASLGGDVWPSWSPDGAWIAFQHSGIYILPADGSSAPVFVTDGTQPGWGP